MQGKGDFEIAATNCRQKKGNTMSRKQMFKPLSLLAGAILFAVAGLFAQPNFAHALASGSGYRDGIVDPDYKGLFEGGMEHGGAKMILAQISPGDPDQDSDDRELFGLAED